MGNFLFLCAKFVKKYIMKKCCHSDSVFKPLIFFKKHYFLLKDVFFQLNCLQTIFSRLKIKKIL